MQCLYKTLDLLPSATDHEIRSWHRRCALSTHPNKGRSAEAFRSVVHAFETLIDTSRRATYDQLRRCRSTSSSASKKRAASSTKLGKPAQPAQSAQPAQPAKEKCTPGKRAKNARAPPKPCKPAVPPATAAAETDCNPGDYAQLFRTLLRMTKKQGVEELQKLSEEMLNAFARFLDSVNFFRTDWRDCVRVAAAQVFRPHPRSPGRSWGPNAARARVGKPPLKGISWINRRIYKTNTSLFTGFEITAQNLKQLDVAIDMHISMVQMRQYVNAGLAEGMDLRQVVQDAIETVQNERATSGAEELRLGFRSQWKRGRTPTTHDLGRAFQSSQKVYKWTAFNLPMTAFVSHFICLMELRPSVPIARIFGFGDLSGRVVVQISWWIRLDLNMTCTIYHETTEPYNAPNSCRKRVTR